VLNDYNRRVWNGGSRRHPKQVPPCVESQQLWQQFRKVPGGAID
jgi:hypothetical protein